MSNRSYERYDPPCRLSGPPAEWPSTLQWTLISERVEPHKDRWSSSSRRRSLCSSVVYASAEQTHRRGCSISWADAPGGECSRISHSRLMKWIQQPDGREQIGGESEAEPADSRWMATETEQSARSAAVTTPSLSGIIDGEKEQRAGGQMRTDAPWHCSANTGTHGGLLPAERGGLLVDLPVMGESFF
ncbi:hypothetical protein EYF80_051544 [Liparis tanakae]|uniref:Uncharacterized protein n=1 Tax=Liparis tanakae TaxID=230148 RepID=A0A4Z2FAR6_9TELE|nr:hypothetical protein EYF80_051544 [Liparis tanakae]